MKSLLLVVLLIVSTNYLFAQQKNFEPNKVVPTKSMIDYQKQELIGFIHFNMNTFTNKEWGYGDEAEALFNPTKLDVEQWVKAAKAGGIKEIILTANKNSIYNNTQFNKENNVAKKIFQRIFILN